MAAHCCGRLECRPIVFLGSRAEQNKERLGEVVLSETALDWVRATSSEITFGQFGVIILGSFVFGTGRVCARLRHRDDLADNK